MIRKRIKLAQNFLKDVSLVRNLVTVSSIGKNDLVYEIGPGDGIITRELAKAAGKVIAIELDPVFGQRLQSKFNDVENVEIVQGDFLNYRLPAHPYKIFSNVPFNITSDIVKRLVSEPWPPESAHLILQKEAAMKFGGYEITTEFSILWKPWFELVILREIDKYSFEPVPSVDPVFFAIKKRSEPLVTDRDKRVYERFVRFGFESWKKDLKTVYQDVFTYAQWKRLSKDLKFPLKGTPGQLTFTQWLGLFHYYMRGVASEKQSRIFS